MTRIMLTRRNLMGATAATGVAHFISSADAETVAIASNSVDPFIGTGGSGHVFPGATMPFGMVQLSPDTDNQRWATCSGFHRDDQSIMGFSHTHLSGTGIGDMCDVLVVPGRGPTRLTPGPLDSPGLGYRQRFTDEHAEPGFYRVLLESGILAELTATERTGLHRYTFPTGAGHLLVDFAHAQFDGPGKPTRIENATLELLDDGTLIGGRQVFRWASGRRIFFALQLSHQPDRVTFYGDGDLPLADGIRHVAGRRLKVMLHFADAGSTPILIRTGISAVDVAGARAALAEEAPTWSFDRARATATHAWNDVLEAVSVRGGSEEQRRVFATALYHSHVAPTLFTDVDGRYVGLDQKIRQTTPERRAYSGYSLWDTYRAWHPLMTLIRPANAAEMTADLLRQSDQNEVGPPIWPLQGCETATMPGWHSVAVMGEAIAKRMPVDVAAAWPIVRRRAFDKGAPDLFNSVGRQRYSELGYVPADEFNDSVSRSLEYAYDDWAMAAVAEAAGALDDAARLRARSRNYRHLFDTGTGFMRAKLADGRWAEPFDPNGIGHMKKWRDYTEATAWQATFFNQHDIYGLIALFGGDAAFAAKLDGLFTASSALPADAPEDISGLIGQYAHGNEPCHHVPYLYAYAGQPWKTQARVRQILTSLYHTGPNGLCGNDDCGQMSAWYVLSALGLYPVDPVSGIYVLGSPLFDRADVRLGKGRRLVIEAIGNSPGHPYVRSVRWNDRSWSRNWISHRELAGGGRLTFVMSAEPDHSFGAAAADRPPSFA